LNKEKLDERNVKDAILQHLRLIGHEATAERNQTDPRQHYVFSSPID